MAIICGTFLYATFFPTNSSNPGLNGGHNNGHLHKEIEALHSQIGQMLEEAKAQKALEKEQLQLIGELNAVVEKQTKEVSAK
jgi:regulator of replication initiation timing